MRMAVPVLNLVILIDTVLILVATVLNLVLQVVLLLFKLKFSPSCTLYGSQIQKGDTGTTGAQAKRAW